MNLSPRAAETRLSPRAAGRLQRADGRGGHQASAPMLSAACSSPTLSCSSSPRGRRYLDSYRLSSPREEQKLQQKGDVERKRAAVKEERILLEEERKREAELARCAREALEVEKKEEIRRLAKEEKQRRAWDIDARREQAALRAQEQATKAEQPGAIVEPRVKWNRRGATVRAQSADVALSKSLSREEEWRRDQQRAHAKMEKELKCSEAQAARERRLQEERQTLDQIKADYTAKLANIEAEKEQRRQQELRIRHERKQQLLANRERRLQKLENKEQEAQARALLEVQQREQRLFDRQREQERIAIEQLEVLGAREKIIHEAQEARHQQSELLRASEIHVRDSQESSESCLQELKAKQLQNERTRRALDIDLRRERAEDKRLRREEEKLREKERFSPMIFPLLPPGPIENDRIDLPGTTILQNALSARGARSHGLYRGFASTGSL